MSTVVGDMRGDGIRDRIRPSNRCEIVHDRQALARPWSTDTSCRLLPVPVAATIRLRIRRLCEQARQHGIRGSVQALADAWLVVVAQAPLPTIRPAKQM